MRTEVNQAVGQGLICCRPSVTVNLPFWIHLRSNCSTTKRSLVYKGYYRGKGGRTSHGWPGLWSLVIDDTAGGRALNRCISCGSLWQSTWRMRNFDQQFVGLNKVTWESVSEGL